MALWFLMECLQASHKKKVWTGVQAAAASAADSLSAVQTNAGKWQTGMTAILTILAVTTAIGGRDAVSGLFGWGKLLVGLLALIALPSNAWALYRFTAASSGRVQILDNQGESRLSQADLEPIHQAKKAIVQLESAIDFVVVSFLFALATLDVSCFCRTLPPLQT